MRAGKFLPKKGKAAKLKSRNIAIQGIYKSKKFNIYYKQVSSSWVIDWRSVEISRFECHICLRLKVH